MKDLKPADAMEIAGGSTGRQLDEQLHVDPAEAKPIAEIDYSPLPQPE